MGRLDGEWDVRRTGGLLPPLVAITKTIRGPAGVSRVAGLPVARFDVHEDGALTRLVYRPPFRGIVDELRPDGDGAAGRMLVAGRRTGSFRMTRLRAGVRPPGGT